MVKKLFVVAALVAGCSTALGVMAASASRAVQTAATQTFSPGPEQTFTLPSAGRLDVVVVAGTGGNNAQNDGFGGYGSVVTATFPSVSPGTYYVDVGANGGTPSGGASGTQPSGGNSGTNCCIGGGGGGGASMILHCSLNSSTCRSLFYTGSEPRLVVAGGGGGAGNDDGCNGGNAGPGTPSASDGPNCAHGGGGGGGVGGNGRDVTDYYIANTGAVKGQGGRGATQGHAGAGGFSSDGFGPGAAGSGPFGGNGFTTTQNATLGAGGGGGYYGGGGGGSCDTSCGTYGAGAGSGSSWVMAGALNVTYGNDTSATPRVQVTYTPKIHKV